MRKILYLFLFSFGASFTAQAQTTLQEKPPEKAPAKEAPTKEASKPETAEEIEGSIDLDSFFKKGEENAKNGASCNKPAMPADPIA